MRNGIIIACLLMVSSCGRENGPVHKEKVQRNTEKADRKKLMDENKTAMELESRDIDAYVKRHDLHAIKSGTGLRSTMVFDVPGEKAKPDDMVSVIYSVELLDGTHCYASGPNLPESFRVAHDEVESGLHEGIQQMSPGDSAVFIIPSHLAFGLIGDMDKIPMRSSVVYHLKLVQVNGRTQW